MNNESPYCVRHVFNALLSAEDLKIGTNEVKIILRKKPRLNLSDCSKIFQKLDDLSFYRVSSRVSNQGLSRKIVSHGLNSEIYNSIIASCSLNSETYQRPKMRDLVLTVPLNVEITRALEKIRSLPKTPNDIYYSLLYKQQF